MIAHGTSDVPTTVHQCASPNQPSREQPVARASRRWLASRKKDGCVKTFLWEFVCRISLMGPCSESVSIVSMLKTAVFFWKMTLRTKGRLVAL